MISKSSSWEIGNNKSYPKLSENIGADVVIIGAGITGIFNAYILSKAGLKVVILEKEKNILQHTTLYTTAFITKIIDTAFDELVDLFGENKAKLIWNSGQDAIDLIAEIVKKENIDCEFKFTSCISYAQNKKQFEEIEEEYEAIKKSGLDATLEKNGERLNFLNAGFMAVPKQAQFHPIKFASALAERAEAAGAKIFTNSEVVAIEGKMVKTKDHQVEAKDILIATYKPFTNEGTRFKKAMYVSYVYELEIKKNLIAEGMYLDMNNPYHYFRVDSFPNFDRMIVGGEDHRQDIKINPEKNFSALLEYVNTILGNDSYKINRQWRGPILEPVDGLPLIGPIKPHTFVATAFSGSGMTYAPISSMVIRDSILKKENPYIKLYSSKRTPSFKQLMAKGADYGQEFFGGALKNFFHSKRKL